MTPKKKPPPRPGGKPKKPTAPKKKSGASRKRKDNKPRKSRSKTGKSQAELQQRDAVIASYVAQDWTWEAIGKEVSLSPRQCRDRYAIFREHTKGTFDADQSKRLEHLVEGMYASISGFEMMSLKALEGEHYAAAVGAKGKAHEVRRDAIKMMQDMGALPRDLSTMRDFYDLRTMAETLWGTFDDCGDMTVAEAREVFRQRLRDHLPATEDVR